jgi:hypothetical protein
MDVAYRCWIFVEKHLGGLWEVLEMVCCYLPDCTMLILAGFVGVEDAAVVRSRLPG